MLKYNYIFINDELIEMLNTLGYVHFVTKKPENSFEKGRAFYYCIENKKYGYVSFLPNEEVKNIERNKEYLRQQIKELNMYDSAKDKQVDDDLLKLTDCCGGQVVFHKGEYVCSCCGISIKQRDKEK